MQRKGPPPRQCRGKAHLLLRVHTPLLPPTIGTAVCQTAVSRPLPPSLPPPPLLATQGPPPTQRDPKGGRQHPIHISHQVLLERRGPQCLKSQKSGDIVRAWCWLVT